MRTIIFAAIAASFALGTAAVAQDVRFRLDERGVTVRGGDDDRDRDRFRERRMDRREAERRRWRNERRMDRTGTVGCRTVTERTVRPNGSVVIRRMERC
jgi:Ni/Co efflux regulator RcnB